MQNPVKLLLIPEYGPHMIQLSAVMYKAYLELKLKGVSMLVWSWYF